MSSNMMDLSAGVQMNCSLVPLAKEQRLKCLRTAGYTEEQIARITAEGLFSTALQGPLVQYKPDWTGSDVIAVASCLEGETLRSSSKWNLPAMHAMMAELKGSRGDMQDNLPFLRPMLERFMECDVNREVLPMIKPTLGAVMPKGVLSLKKTQRELTVLRWLYGPNVGIGEYQTIRDHIKPLQEWIIERAKVVSIQHAFMNDISRQGLRITAKLTT